MLCLIFGKQLFFNRFGLIKGVLGNGKVYAKDVPGIKDAVPMAATDLIKVLLFSFMQRGILVLIGLKYQDKFPKRKMKSSVTVPLFATKLPLNFSNGRLNRFFGFYNVVFPPKIRIGKS